MNILPESAEIYGVTRYRTAWADVELAIFVSIFGEDEAVKHARLTRAIGTENEGERP